MLIELTPAEVTLLLKSLDALTEFAQKGKVPLAAMGPHLSLTRRICEQTRERFGDKTHIS